jgi:hypothetical protein
LSKTTVRGQKPQERAEPDIPHLPCRDRRFFDRVLSRHSLSHYSQCSPSGNRSVGGDQVDFAWQARHRSLGHRRRVSRSRGHDADVCLGLVWRRRRQARFRRRLPCGGVIGSRFPVGDGNPWWVSRGAGTYTISAAAGRGPNWICGSHIGRSRAHDPLWRRDCVVRDRHLGPAMARNLSRPPDRNRR